MTSQTLSPEQQQSLRSLVATLARQRLLVPARILATIVTPFALLGSQTALFLHPLLPVARWRTYADIFSNEGAWNELHRLLEQQER